MAHTRRVTICTDFGCDGECYACRLRACSLARTRAESDLAELHGEVVSLLFEAELCRERGENIPPDHPRMNLLGACLARQNPTASAALARAEGGGA